MNPSFFVFFFISFGFCSDFEGDFDRITNFEADEQQEFVPLPTTFASSTGATAVATDNLGNLGNLKISGSAENNDDNLMEESVTINLDCEKSLGSSEEALRSFVMKSLDVSAEETLVDLERPSCRALFDRNGYFLSREQVSKLLESERGKRILVEGEVMEFFNDFSEFTLEDFDQFPGLQVGKIRNLSSIPGKVLLGLVKQGGFSKAGRLDRLPETFGIRVLDDEDWKLDPEIWQLFTLEGISQIGDLESALKFADFLADRKRFEELIFKVNPDGDDLGEYLSDLDNNENATFEDGEIFSQFGSESKEDANNSVSMAPSSQFRLRSLTISSDVSFRSTLPSSRTSTPLCKSIAKHSNLLARWAVQCEEFMLYLVDLSEAGGRSVTAQLPNIQRAVKGLIKTRGWIKDQLLDRCNGASAITDLELMHLSNLKAILGSPMAWRLKESIKLHTSHSVNNLDNPAITPMTRLLYNRLKKFQCVIDFYKQSLNKSSLQTISNDQLLTHFFLVNNVSDLDSIFGAESNDLSVAAGNERFVLAIALRRILLSLLSPTIEPLNAIQDALNYVFSSNNSSSSSTADSNEVLRWFHQAQDLQAIPVLDQLIRSFGHEFDVHREIQSMLANRDVRMRLFLEAQSSVVRLLVTLSNGLSEHLIQDSPKIIIFPYIDPANSLLKSKVDPLPEHPKRRPYTQEEIDEHKSQVDEVAAHNAAISNSLQASLRFLKSFQTTPHLSPYFAGFIQPNFRVQFNDNIAVDAGGLRRTWLSALFRIFGDSQRQLFPLHEVAGGRVPSALLDPEIMSHLGALHGKALQIGVKPDWFFNRKFTQTFLFTPDNLDNPENLEELSELVEFLYPTIFESFQLILELENEEDIIEYFNASEFPTIAGLTDAGSASASSAVNAASVHSGDSAGSVDSDESDDSAGNTEHDPQNSLNIPQTSQTSQNNAHDQSSPISDFSFSSAAIPIVPDSPDSNSGHLLQNQFAMSAHQFTDDSDDNDNDDQDRMDISNPIFTNLNSYTSTTNNNPNTDTTPSPLLSLPKPPRHSFSRMLVFNAQFLAQPSIYSGPRETIQTLEQFHLYRSQLRNLFASNLLKGRQAYTESLNFFFDSEYKNLIDPEFLHDLLEPPVVTIEEILTRVQFHRSCDLINLIDTVEGESGNSESYHSDLNEHVSKKMKSDDQDTSSPRSTSTTGTTSSTGTTGTTSNTKISNISARTALTRILTSSFQSPHQISSLLSFATGCPQIPPAGLDGLRITVHCYQADNPIMKMSKSHTCTNDIEFMVSMKFEDTRDAFIESVLSSSGFGFA